MKYKNTFLKKIQDKSVRVGIIGLGYVGIPLALEFCEQGIKVLGFDIDEKKVELLNNGISYFKHISSEKIKNVVNNEYFAATNDFKRLKEVDAILICVPTPLNHNREPDLSYIENTATVISENLREGQLICLESSTYPGTTNEIIKPRLDEPLNPELANKKLEVGKDYFLAYSPEREDPNNPNFTTKKIPKVVGGYTSNCLEVAKGLYDLIIEKTVPVSSTKVAEAVKLLENIYRSVNIALVNELKMVFDKMGIDIWEVIEAAKTKPFGFQAFYPGPGLGGHCIPIDPFYLTWKAREYDVSTKFIELAGEINTYQPYFVVQKVIEALNDNNKTLRDSKILVLGVAYKKNVDDMRESPALKLIDILSEKNAIVDYNDPYCPIIPKTRKYDFGLKSIDLTKENLEKYDLVLILTDHDDYDFNFIYENAKLIVDTRNAIKINGLVNGKVYKS